jgi:Right handed beta helix region/Beta-propeller repeat
VSRSAKQSILATFAIVATISIPVRPTASSGAARAETITPASRSKAGDRTSTVKHSYLRTPLRFERADAQANASSDFVGRGIGYAVSLSNGDAIVTVGRSGERPETISIRLAGRRASVEAAADRELPGRSSHLIGNDPRRWRTGVAAYARIAYHDVYPGIDLVYYGTQQQLEYDFVIRPGASPADIAFDIAGAREVRLDESGNLVIDTEAGSLTHHAPVVYQDVHGARQPVEGRYVVRPGGRVTFEVGHYDRDLPLVIDPVLSYATYLGGANEERIHGVAVNASGSVTIVGETFSDDFPTANPAQAQRAAFGDAFVATLSADGSALVYATYLGGSNQDAAMAVDLDASGAAYVTGSTFSWDFPTLNGFQNANNGQTDTFVVKLDAGGGLVYSTLLGGMLEEYATAIDVDGFGRAHVTGSTLSADFPTVNALQSSLGGSPVFRTTNGGETWVGLGNGLRTINVFAFAIDPAAPETVYAGSYIEGVFKSTDSGATWLPTGREAEGQRQVVSLAVGGGTPSAVYSATNFGIHRSLDGGDSWNLVFPNWGAAAVVVSPQSPSTIYAGFNTNGFPFGVFKSIDGGESWSDTGLAEGVNALAVSGSTIYAATPRGVYSSIGGGGWTQVNAGMPPSQPIAIAADATNPAVAYAATFDGLFKTVNGGASWDVVPVFTGVPIATVAVSQSDPSTLLVSLLFGGTGISNDAGENWRLTHSDTAIVWAIAIHPSVATTAYLGGTIFRDAFVATIGAAGDTLEFSTYFGGSGHERATDIAVDSGGARYLVGETGSTDLPVVNQVQTAFGGLQDAFAARIGPEGVTYTTYLGGSGFESVPRMAVDASGNAHIAGLTWSVDYPVVNPYQPEPAGGSSEAFVTVLDPSGGFVHSTYLGGTGAETDASQSLGPDVAVTNDGDTYVTGSTMSLDFPVSADALQSVHGGGQNDAFLTRFDAAGQLRYSTYLGGAGDDYGRSVSVGFQGDVAVAGYTNSTDFPTRNALQPIPAGSDEGFVARITSESAPSDTIPPVTTIVLAGTPGLAGWYRSSVVVTLSAIDNESGSGVAAIRYRLNGGPLQTYSGPFTVDAQGITGVTAQALDHAGNVETAAPATTVSIDTDAPAIAIVSPQARQYLDSGTLNVSVSVSETVSGLGGPASVTLDGVPLSGTAIDLSALAPGSHVLAASATDIAGNTSQTAVTFGVVSVLDTIINVPSEVATIQAAIDWAVDGGTVLVAPGTYTERINFRGKAVTVISAGGPEQTIIDAGGAGSAVSFTSGESRAAVLSGFTIRGGATLFRGGGIHIQSSSPTIRGNVVTGNRGCAGGGIWVGFGSPLIQGNRITRNETSCAGGSGAGVLLAGGVAPELVDNEILENTASNGGGISLFNGGNAIIRNNVITRNAAVGDAIPCSAGGGIESYGSSQATIVGNLIVGNSACQGGGIFWRTSTGRNVLVNNTIADNDAESWPGMYVTDFDAGDELHNNIITAHTGPALYCSISSPTLNSNDIFSPQGAVYGGTCADQTGLNGNISVDPAFLGPANRDYRVAMTSAVVDSGNAAAPALPSTDLTGLDRVFDGNGDGVARVDMGALESRNRAPVVNAGADRTIVAGANCQGQVVLTAVASDADGDPVSVTWSGAFGTASGPSLSLTLPLGTHVITATANDGIGGRASDTVVVTVVDTTPPVITGTNASPSVIEKPNHMMVPVEVHVDATDGCGAVDCRIVSVASNEEGTGDWEITGPLTLNVRAERLGRGNGRIYTITIECRDAAGNVATSTVTVTVPVPK